MTEIQVDPDALRAVARQWAEASQFLEETRSSLTSAWTNLEGAGWEGRHRQDVDPLWQSAQHNSRVMADQTFSLSRQLFDIAQRFEETENELVAAVEQLAQRVREWLGSIADRLWPPQIPDWTHRPSPQPPGDNITPEPIDDNVIRIPDLVIELPDIPDWIVNWLRGLFFPQEEE